MPPIPARLSILTTILHDKGNMDPYQNIVDFYDLEHDPFDEDASFYNNIVRDGPVLEVGCGTGRLLQKLAPSRLQLHGVDTSEAMLRAARNRLVDVPNVHLHLGSVESLRLPYSFKTVLVPLNVLWHITTLQGQIEALRAIRDHMKRDCLLVVDVSNPLNMVDRSGGREVRQRFAQETPNGFVQCFSTAEEWSEDQRLKIALWYDLTGQDQQVRRTRASLDLRYTYRFELELMIEMTGFVVGQVYGSYDLEPYSPSSSNIIVVAASG